MLNIKPLSNKSFKLSNVKANKLVEKSHIGIHSAVISKIDNNMLKDETTFKFEFPNIKHDKYNFYHNLVSSHNFSDLHSYITLYCACKSKNKDDYAQHFPLTVTTSIKTRDGLKEIETTYQSVDDYDLADSCAKKLVQILSDNNINYPAHLDTSKSLNKVKEFFANLKLSVAIASFNKSNRVDLYSVDYYELKQKNSNTITDANTNELRRLVARR